MEINEQRELLKSIASTIIDGVLEAGAKQRKDGDENEWLNRPAEYHIHRAHMHLIRCKTHEGQNDDVWSIAEDTYLYDAEHALLRLVMANYIRLYQEP